MRTRDGSMIFVMRFKMSCLGKGGHTPFLSLTVRRDILCSAAMKHEHSPLFFGVITFSVLQFAFSISGNIFLFFFCE